MPSYVTSGANQTPGLYCWYHTASQDLMFVGTVLADLVTALAANSYAGGELEARQGVDNKLIGYVTASGSRVA